MRTLQEQAQEKRDEAVDLEYDLMTQSLTSAVEPLQAQTEDISNLHKQAKDLVSQVYFKVPWVILKVLFVKPACVGLFTHNLIVSIFCSKLNHSSNLNQAHITWQTNGYGLL